jgi:hypothetical protein
VQQQYPLTREDDELIGVCCQYAQVPQQAQLGRQHLEPVAHQTQLLKALHSPVGRQPLARRLNSACCL